MSAREMFEELGYKQFIGDKEHYGIGEFIQYNNYEHSRWITFDFYDKTIKCSVYDDPVEAMDITINELLSLIKDGKAPKKIKVTGRIYDYDEKYEFYYTKSNKANYNVSLGGLEDEINLIANAFNENVEIIEEDKKIEKCKSYECFEGIDDYIEHLRHKIDELIDVVNELKKGK